MSSLDLYGLKTVVETHPSVGDSLRSMLLRQINTIELMEQFMKSRTLDGNYTEWERFDIWVNGLDEEIRQMITERGTRFA